MEEPLRNLPTEVRDSPNILSMALGFLNPSPQDGRKKKKSRKKKKKRSRIQFFSC
jgi:hypothetical protein